MSIKSKFIIIAIVFLAASFLVSLVMFQGNNTLGQELEKQKIASEIQTHIFQREILRDDYLLHHSERSLVQLQTMSRDLDRIFVQASRIFTSVDDQASISLLINNKKFIDQNLFKIVDNYQKQNSNPLINATDQQPVNWAGLEQQLISQVLIKSQDDIALAERLEETSRTKVTASQQKTISLILIVVISVFLIIVAALYIIWSSMGRPLLRLKEIATRVASLNFAVTTVAAATNTTASNDEIGQLTRAFNTMVEKLREKINALTASENRVFQKTDELQEKVDDSNKTKKAILNILEDTKELEETLKEERDRSRAIISSMGDGLLLIDREYKVVLINQIGGAWLRYPPAEAQGKKLDNIFRVFDALDNPFDIKKHINQVLTTGNVVKFGIKDNLFCKDKKGRTFPVALVFSPFLGDGITGSVIIFRDITEEKALDLAKTDFISIASHQLRTPLTVVRWYAEILDSTDVGKLNKEQKEFVDLIYKGSLKLNDIINMLLLLARVETGKMEAKISEVNPTGIISDILGELKPFIAEKVLKVEIIEPKEKIANFNFDEPQIHQTLTNLISNSIRYTNRGGNIKVGVVRDKENMHLTYSVADDGIGITKSQQDKIFNRFYRADNARAFYPDGSGLGLALVKMLVENWGGKVWFESTENKGSTFYFTVPLFPLDGVNASAKKT